jgi:hypothetical protein
MLSSFLASPREGHLSEALHIFSYLKRHRKSAMVFDNTLPNIDESIFQQNYRDAQEKLPLNAPEPKGKPIRMYCFCDSNHAGDHINH